MKRKSLLCVAALAALTGCMHQQNPYASFGEYGFSHDLEQQPVPGLTVAENERIAHMPAATVTQLLTVPVVVPTPAPQMMAPGAEAHPGTPPPAPEATPGAIPPTTPAPVPPPDVTAPVPPPPPPPAPATPQ